MSAKNIIDPSTLPYRHCVGILVFNAARQVWTGRRIVGEDEDKSHLWQLPQGGVDQGERPVNAAWRELYEETGIKSATLMAEISNSIFYDLPPDLIGTALKGKYRGQKLCWYAFQFHGEESEIQINPPPDGHQAEFDDWAWRPLAELPNLVVPFKKEAYKQMVAGFAHLTR